MMENYVFWSFFFLSLILTNLLYKWTPFLKFSDMQILASQTPTSAIFRMLMRTSIYPTECRYRVIRNIFQVIS